MIGRSLFAGMSTLTKTVAAISAVLIAVGAVVGTVVLTRPKAPPPSDSQAGARAAKYCIDSISDAVATGAAKIAIPGADKVIKAINYTQSGVEVVTNAGPGGNVGHAQYSVAIFIVQVIGEYRSPVLQILGETGEPGCAVSRRCSTTSRRGPRTSRQDCRTGYGVVRRASTARTCCRWSRRAAPDLTTAASLRATAGPSTRACTSTSVTAPVRPAPSATWRELAADHRTSPALPRSTSRPRHCAVGVSLGSSALDAVTS